LRGLVGQPGQTRHKPHLQRPTRASVVASLSAPGVSLFPSVCLRPWPCTKKPSRRFLLTPSLPLPLGLALPLSVPLRSLAANPGLPYRFLPMPPLIQPGFGSDLPASSPSICAPLWRLQAVLRNVKLQPALDPQTGVCLSFE